ncbi:thioredoxin domain-containing protein 12-like isoform X3 [Schistocerca americana]|uniref:thioredoxin domain-containing protein 12-like isoform X3 n=1 Tax=Schistocerca americana TaxID=7009 RepID=UPI001F502895|nr:thioredoxin domain-containing protein 12-like isoform X3 [Schistocerca americana]
MTTLVCSVLYTKPTTNEVRGGEKSTCADMNPHLYCSTTTALKPQFAESKEIEELSSNFVMVNVGDDDKVVGSSFAPDGEYIPRIIFMSPDGEVRPEFYNEGGSEAYKYFYSDISNIITTMKKVQRAYKKKLKSKDTTEL